MAHHKTCRIRSMKAYIRLLSYDNAVKAVSFASKKIDNVETYACIGISSVYFQYKEEEELTTMYNFLETLNVEFEITPFHS